MNITHNFNINDFADAATKNNCVITLEVINEQQEIRIEFEPVKSLHDRLDAIRGKTE